LKNNKESLINESSDSERQVDSISVKSEDFEGILLPSPGGSNLNTLYVDVTVETVNFSNSNHTSIHSQ